MRRDAYIKDGFIFVFVSNSSPEIPVYFDDLTIDYTMPARPKRSIGGNPIDQASDYYPFGGLMGSGFERIISKANACPSVAKRRRDFRYQGKEYDKDLQWYACPSEVQRRRDFHARQYDPYLGRFLAADPMMQFSSPYNGMGNNPINIIDPTGMLGKSRSSSTVGGTEREDNWSAIDHTSNNHFADQAERFGHAYRGGHTGYGTAGEAMGYRNQYGSYYDTRYQISSMGSRFDRKAKAQNSKNLARNIVTFMAVGLQNSNGQLYWSSSNPDMAIMYTVLGSQPSLLASLGISDSWHSDEVGVYTLSSGDRLSEVAVSHNMTVSELISLNGLRAKGFPKLKSGDDLEVYTNRETSLGYLERIDPYHQLRTVIGGGASTMILFGSAGVSGGFAVGGPKGAVLFGGLGAVSGFFGGLGAGYAAWSITDYYKYHKHYNDPIE